MPNNQPNNHHAIFESTYSDNFQPNLLEKLIKSTEKYRAVAMSELIKNQGGVFVDLACGDGDFIDQVRSKYRQLFGFDVSSKRLANAQKKLGGFSEIKLRKTDLDRGIPLQNDFADTIICEASLSYFRNPEFITKEIYRVLKPGGEFIVQIGNYAFLPRRIALLSGRLPKVSSFAGFGDGGMIHYFTYGTLRNLLESHGLIITAQSNSGVLAAARKIYPDLLASDIIFRAVKK